MDLSILTVGKILTAGVSDKSLYSHPSVHKECFSDVFSSVTHFYKGGMDAQPPVIQNGNYTSLMFMGKQLQNTFWCPDSQS